jgi:iron complex outermembrane recepter protein
MAKNDVLRRAVRCALFANAAAAAAVPLAAHADAEGPAAPAAEAPAAAPVAEVVVTGSRIVEPGLTSVSPVTTVSSEQIKQSGVTRIEDLLNTMPQVMGDMGGDLSNGASGTATVNLRGLGVQRTLVLINGRRLMPGDPNSAAASSAADLNNIPAALVERVDVLTGGASSTYGADAVAGVVNFVMNDHFEGFKIDANGSIYNHTNNNPIAASFEAPGQPGIAPPHTVNDGAQEDLTLIYGRNLADGAGNFTAYGGYRHVTAVLGASRDFSICTPDPNTGTASGLPFVCGGSSTSFPGRFIPNNNNAFNQAAGGDYTLGGANGNQFTPWLGAASKYNYAPSNFFQRPDDRWTAGNFMHLDITDKIQVYEEFMFMHDESDAQIAPGGAFIGQGGAVNLPGTLPASDVGLPNGNVQVNCANPFLSTQQLQILCNGSTAGNAQLLLGRRDVEGGDRINDLTHTSFRLVAGVKGEIIDGWKFDTYAMEGLTDLTNYGTGNFSKTNLSNALDVVIGPGGTPVCASGANGCVPYNVFKIGGVTQAALNYVDIPTLIAGSSEERVWDGNITGDLGKYGIKVPGNSDGLLINFGSQYRSEYATVKPDAPDASFDVLGSGGPTLPLAAGFHVWEGYIEGGMPIITDKPFAKELSFETGYRYSSYTEGFNTNTYKFGLNWAPTSDVRFRGSYQRAVRAPNLQELFVEKGLVLEGASDPCDSTTSAPANPLSNCSRGNPGITNPAQYGHVLASPAGQYNGLTGGNPHLKPEQADTTSFGFVLTPSIVPNLSLTVDYFNIRIKDVISSYGYTLQLNQCLQNNIPTFCNDVHRDAAGTLWASSEAYINDPTLNLGALQSRGVDLTAAYKYDLERLGRLSFNFAGTYTAQFITEPGGVLGVQSYNCAGYYGNTCGVPQPKWKHVFNINYDTPLEGLGLGLRWRYLSQVLQDTNSPNPLLNGSVFPYQGWGRIPSYSYFDLTASYVVNKTVSLRLGVNNVMDKDPPLQSTDFFSPPFENNNTYPSVYDALGRYMFANVTLTF